MVIVVLLMALVLGYVQRQSNHQVWFRLFFGKFLKDEKFCPTVIPKERCYGELGCFSTGGDFADRVVNFLPQDRDKINTRFYLHTRKNVNMWDAVQLKAHDVKGLLESPFNPKSLTKFIVHGFLDNSYKPWVEVNASPIDWRVCNNF